MHKNLPYRKIEQNSSNVLLDILTPFFVVDIACGDKPHNLA